MTANAMQAVPREQALPPDALEARYDIALASTVIGLVSLGLVMVASASISTANRALGEPLYYFWRQAGFVAVGLGAGWLSLATPLEVWRRQSPLLLLAGGLFLLLVLVPGIGKEINGSMRWLRVGPFSLQPSELMKIFAILYLAGYLVRRGDEVRRALIGFFKPIAVFGLIALLLLLEPDYGATVVLLATALGMMFLGGVPIVSFFSWLLLVGALLGGVILAEPYRIERLTTFVDPWADPFGSGFQLTQALIAIGRGEWFGVGIGNSVQKLFYLPEAHTDFLFAVLAEELGLVGMSVVIAAFAFVVWRAFSIARLAERVGLLFGAYLCHGLGLLIGLQAFINIGVNLGILPTKGLTLPLMSYGGSSVLASCVAIGLLLRVDHEVRTLR